MGAVVNPKKREVIKDLHIYVPYTSYERILKILEEKQTITGYVAELIEKDLDQRGV